MIVSERANETAAKCAVEASKMIAPFVDLIREHRIESPIAENNDIKFAEIIQKALDEENEELKKLVPRL